jgi:PAS domain S-box-containing protein
MGKSEKIENRKDSIQDLKKKNQSLQSALDEYRSMVDKYRTLAECSLAGIYVIQDGQFQYVNPRLVEMLGYDREEDLIGLKFWQLVHPEDRPIVRNRGLRREKEAVYPLRYTFRALKKNGSIAWADMRGMTARYLGRPANIGTVVDITEQKKVEEELRKHQGQLEERVRERTAEFLRANERLKREVEDRERAERKSSAEKNFSDSVINSLPGVFYLFDESGRMIKWNDNLEMITGYLPEDILSKNALEFFQAEDRALVQERIRETFEKGRSFVEATIEAKTGQLTPYLLTGVRLNLEGKIYLIGVGVDISERKKAEQALLASKQELRDLSAKLIHVQEKERRHLAMELHDGLGQSLSAINFSLEKMMKKSEQDSDSKTISTLEQVLPMIKSTIEEVRRMSRDLRPSMLDDLGIMTTLTWFCRNFGKVYPDISIKKRIGIKEKEIPEHLKIVIFRILQEALNNVAKHSQAKQVEIRLGRKGKAIEFRIQDNGRGFTQKTALSSDSTHKGFGLTSMKDRTELSGGTFKLKTAPRGGTAILARWLVEVS